MSDNTSAPPPASKSYAPGEINSLIRDIGAAKSAAARARFAGRPSDAQDTRAVYLETCAAIAVVFEPRGYKFSKSGPHFTAKSRDKQFTYRISFQSSHNNIPGQHIRLLVHTSISSPVVKKWKTALWARHGRTYQGNGSIAGTQLGYLAEPGKRAWVAWELAHEHTRAAAIAEVTDRITHHALPWFAQCEDIPRLVGRVVETGVFPDCHVENFPAELLLCFASREQTARALAAYIKTLHPKARANLHKDLAAARDESPLKINHSGFFGCRIRYLLAEGIEFPKE